MALTLKDIIARKKNVSQEKSSDTLVTSAVQDNNQLDKNVTSRAVNNKNSADKVRLINPGDYYRNGSFNSTLVEFQKFNSRKTGYDNLDEVQSFYPGLYVVGAISSLGKTTFCHQMADQLAVAGESVLYFSLEQNVFELFSKSISRRFFQDWLNDKSNPVFNSMEIRRGVPSESHSEILNSQINGYIQSVGSGLNVAECNFNATVEDIQTAVKRYMDATEKKPIVFIDYLQIISPTLVNGYPGSSKSNIDHIVHSLKCFQSEHNLVVVIVSSLNRQNYMVPIDFESFKESGGIEYTADVVWGLQLAAINNEIFSKEGKIKEKREIIRQAKSANPRLIQLVCIKNRYGISSYTVEFDYYPAGDIFVPRSDDLENSW